MTPERYQAVPFQPFDPSSQYAAERAVIVGRTIRNIARFENLFTDYERACEPICEDVMSCERCAGRIANVSRSLTDPKARVWEVWRLGAEPDVVGIVYLTNVAPGCDALAHYVFFDNDLVGKTDLLKEMIGWCFTDHDEWKALRRITVEVPTYAFALARHAVQKLGFGGDYQYRYQHAKQKQDSRRKEGYATKRRVIQLPVEGVKRRALRWGGRDADILVLGKTNG